MPGDGKPIGRALTESHAALQKDLAETAAGLLHRVNLIGVQLPILEGLATTIAKPSLTPAEIKAFQKGFKTSLKRAAEEVDKLQQFLKK